MESIPDGPILINDSFLSENLAVIEKEICSFADYANFLVGKYLSPKMMCIQRKMFFNDLKHYFWDEPSLYRHGSDGMVR